MPAVGGAAEPLEDGVQPGVPIDVEARLQTGRAAGDDVVPDLLRGQVGVPLVAGASA